MNTRCERFPNLWLFIGLLAVLWTALCSGSAWSAPYAYIIDKTSGMDIIDAASNTLIKRVSSNGLGPSSVAVNPDGTRVYVTENNSSSLSVLDALGSPVKSVPVSSNPQKAIVHPYGKRVYVSYRYAAQAFISIIDADTNTVMADKLVPPSCTSTPCSLSIGDIALSPDGTRLYAVVSYITSSPTAYKLMAFDTSNYQTVATVDLGSNGYLNSIAVNSTGTRLYASQSTGNYPSIQYNILVIDASNPSSLQVIASKSLAVATKIISAVGTEIIVSPDDTKVYVNTGDISIMDTSTYAVTSVPINFGVGYNNVPGHIAMNPDGSRIYVTGFYLLNPPYNNYSYLDTASNTLVKTAAQVPICQASVCFDPIGIAIGPAIQTQAPNVQAVCLFNWAERNYPNLFAPAKPSTAVSNGYTARFYSATNAHLGYSSDTNHVYYLDADGNIQDEGNLTDWIPISGCQTPAPPQIECLLNWAEDNYSSLFAPSGSHSAVFDFYNYRYYSVTQSYLGYSKVDNHVYYMGTDGKLADEGPSSYWLPIAGCQ